MRLSTYLCIALVLSVAAASVQRRLKESGLRRKDASTTSKAFLFAGFEEKSHMGTLKVQVLEKGKEIQLPKEIQKLDWLSVMDENSPLRVDGFREWLPSKRGMLFRRRQAVDSDEFDFVECKAAFSEKVAATNPNDETQDVSVPVAVTHFSCKDLKDTDIAAEAAVSLLEERKKRKHGKEVKKPKGKKGGKKNGKGKGKGQLQRVVTYPYVSDSVWSVPEYYTDYIPNCYWHDINDYYVDGEQYYYPYGWDSDVWGDWNWRYFGVSPDGYYACNKIDDGACVDAVTYFPYYYDYYWDSPDVFWDHPVWA